MSIKPILRGGLTLAFIASLLLGPLSPWIIPPLAVQAAPAASSGISAAQLILAMNTLRVSYGLPALVEDGIIDAVAQGTANTMAANEMSWHIGNVSGRVQAAGYGGGAKVWATENFASGYFHSIDEIMQVWSDPSHMIPAVNPAYCNIGAGEAKAPNGMMYYVLQAAYTSAKSCGDYTSVGKPGTSGVTNPGVPQVIVPVKIATPDAQGRIYHVVEAGQSFWAIAIAYKITIKDIRTWNNLSDSALLQVGEKLFIPSSNTVGYSTPTPVGMVQISTPDKDGKIVHIVQAYQNLSTIASAYNVSINVILALNGIQSDWPLQIGQKLVIQASTVTPSPTPRPLTPLQKLTPASDGNYYHIVQSGETLSWIAQLYQVALGELEAWNNMDSSTILQPGQKLLLKVTPPATITPTPAPASHTPTVTHTRPIPTGTPAPSLTATSSPEATGQAQPAKPDQSRTFWYVAGGLAAGGLFLVILFSRKRAP